MKTITYSKNFELAISKNVRKFMKAKFYENILKKELENPREMVDKIRKDLHAIIEIALLDEYAVLSHAAIKNMNRIKK